MYDPRRTPEGADAGVGRSRASSNRRGGFGMSGYQRPTDFIAQPITLTECTNKRVTAVDARGLVIFSCGYWLYCRMVERGWVIE